MQVTSLNTYALAAAQRAYGEGTETQIGQKGVQAGAGILKADLASFSPEAYALLERARQAVNPQVEGFTSAAGSGFEPAEPVYSGEFIDNIALKAFRENVRESADFPQLLKDMRSSDPELFLEAFSQVTGVPVDELRERLTGADSDELAAIAESLGSFTNTDPAEYLKTLQALQWSPTDGGNGAGLAA